MMPMNPNQYPSSLKLRLDWSEMDLFGHINNVQYFKYIQASRVHLWHDLDFAAHHRNTGVGPMLASTQCQFRKPLFFPGEIEVRAKISFMKNTSFGIDHVIFDGEGEACAFGADVIVVFDFNTNVKQAIPDWLRSKLKSFQ